MSEVAEAPLPDPDRLFSGPVRFLLSAPGLEHLPEPTVPEIAFAGRSNVGKSSLLNALTGRKALARTSVTPGRTQELNVFEVAEPMLFRLVDMPGYGFAKAPEKVVAAWRRTVEAYLRGRQPLRRAIVLIDGRHGIKPVDREIMDLLDRAAVGYRVALTKADKVKPSELERTASGVAEELRRRPAAHPDLLTTSSDTGQGIAELRAAVVADALG